MGREGSGRGLIDSQLGKDLQRLCKDYLCTSDHVDPGGEVNQWSTWKGSVKTLQGLPLTMLILRGSIDSQLGKDLQRLWKDYLCTSDHVDLGGRSTVNLERICKDFGRITSDNVNPGGLIDGQLGKDP